MRSVQLGLSVLQFGLSCPIAFVQFGSVVGVCDGQTFHLIFQEVSLLSQ